jgi:hypothetical protein
VVNVPLEPGTGEGAWLGAVRTLVPELAAAFGPDLVVSQHGADSHAWDPLAHLRVTTTAMGEAARLVDAVAHRYASGRWLATGGGGYDVYRVVPRTWALTWLAGAHRDVPDATPPVWRERWAAEASRYGQAPLPLTFDDAPNAGVPDDAAQLAAESRSRETIARVRELVVPQLLREARDRGWWDPLAPTPSVSGAAPPGAVTPGAVPPGAVSPGVARGGVPGRARPEIVPVVDAATWSRLSLAPGVIAPADPAVAHRLVLAAILDGAVVSAAAAGARVVGLAIAGPPASDGRRDLLALGVHPTDPRADLAARLLAVSPAQRRP